MAERRTLASNGDIPGAQFERGDEGKWRGGRGGFIGQRKKGGRGINRLITARDRRDSLSVVVTGFRGRRRKKGDVGVCVTWG